MSPQKRRTLPPSSVESIQLFTRGDKADSSLLDLVDNLLNNGVMLEGELILGVGGVDLIYARLSLLLSAMDRVRDQSPLGRQRKGTPARGPAAQPPRRGPQGARRS